MLIIIQTNNTSSIRRDFMPAACTINNNMSGSVAHHAGHIIGWTGGEEPSPIYCSGHGVSGVQRTGNSKVMINGIPVARLGDSGSTDCACDGQPYTNSSASNKVIVGGIGAVRVGDQCNIHGAGTGTMITGHSKVMMS